MFKVLVWAQTLENSILQHRNLPKEECDSMVVSPTGTNEGKKILTQHIIFEISLFQILVEVPSSLIILENCWR